MNKKKSWHKKMSMPSQCFTVSAELFELVLIALIVVVIVVVEFNPKWTKVQVSNTRFVVWRKARNFGRERRKIWGKITCAGKIMVYVYELT